MAFLIDHYKGKYRLLCEYDQSTNQFSRKLNGCFEDIDIYIACQKGIRIFYYGSSKLQAYIPSLQTGRNIVKTIYSEYINPQNCVIEQKEIVKEDGTKFNKATITIKDYDLMKSDLKRKSSIIYNIEETDSEVLFLFHSKYMEQFENIFKPKTSGASISPFSTKNLPLNKSYIIPDEELKVYKDIVQKIPQNQILSITHTTKSFIKSLATKKNDYEAIKNDMSLKCLKAKEYIHSIGKWNEYLVYLEKNLLE